MSRYRVTVEFDMMIEDETAVQEVAHRQMTEIISVEQAKGIGLVSDFVDTGQQVADYAAQNMLHAVQLATLKILADGVGAVQGVSLTRFALQRPELLEG